MLVNTATVRTPKSAASIHRAATNVCLTLLALIQTIPFTLNLEESAIKGETEGSSLDSVG